MLAAARLSADALTTIVDALRPIQGRCSAQDFAAAERELVDAAAGNADQRPCDIHAQRIMAGTWALYLDPGGSMPDEEYAERMRGLRLGRSRRGLRRISGDVTDDLSAQFERLMDAHLNPRVQDRGPRFSASDDSDRECDDHVHDPRTVYQKRPDAFASMLSAAAASAQTPTLGGAAPHTDRWRPANRVFQRELERARSA